MKNTMSFIIHRQQYISKFMRNIPAKDNLTHQKLYFFEKLDFFQPVKAAIMIFGWNKELNWLSQNFKNIFFKQLILYKGYLILVVFNYL